MEPDSLSQRIESTGTRLAVLERRVEQAGDRDGQRGKLLEEMSAILGELRQEHEELSTSRESRQIGEDTRLADSFFQDITDREQVEKTLRENERRLQHAQELLEAVTRGTEVIIAVQDTSLRYTFFNKTYEEEIKRLTGKDIQIGTSMAEVFAHMPEQQKVAVEEWRQILRGESVRHTMEFGDPGRHRRVYDILHTPIRDAQGNVVGAGEVAYDVTERVQTQEALRKSEEQLRSLYASMTEGVALHEIVYDPRGQAADYVILDVNPAYEAITGLPKERAIGHRASELYGIGQPPYIEIYSQVTASGRPASFETYFAPMEKHLSISVFSSGRGTFATVFADITARKQAEEERERLLAENRSQREFLESLVDTAPIGIAVLRGPDHRHEMVNPYYRAIPGMPNVPMIGRTLAEVFPDLPARGVLEYIEAVYRTGQTVSIREQEASVGPGREQTYWNVDHVPLHNVGGDVEGVLVLASEVSEQVRHRRQIEELATVLQSERNILQIIMENTRTHLAHLDPDFNFVAVNLTYAQGSGYSREALIGRNHFALFPDAENQAIFEQVRDTGKPVEFHAKPFEFPGRPELGTTYWDWTLVPVKGVDGQTNGLVLSLTDVTGQIRAQAEIESLARFPGENPNPVLRMTREGTILYANPCSAPLLAHWTTRVGQKVPDEWQRRIAEALDSGVGQIVEAPCDTRTFSFTITPIAEKGYANLGRISVWGKK